MDNLDVEALVNEEVEDSIFKPYIPHINEEYLISRITFFVKDIKKLYYFEKNEKFQFFDVGNLIVTDEKLDFPSASGHYKKFIFGTVGEDSFFSIYYDATAYKTPAEVLSYLKFFDFIKKTYNGDQEADKELQLKLEAAPILLGYEMDLQQALQDLSELDNGSQYLCSFTMTSAMVMPNSIVLANETALKESMGAGNYEFENFLFYVKHGVIKHCELKNFDPLNVAVIYKTDLVYPFTFIEITCHVTVENKEDLLYLFSKIIEKINGLNRKIFYFAKYDEKAKTQKTDLPSPAKENRFQLDDPDKINLKLHAELVDLINKNPPNRGEVFQDVEKELILSFVVRRKIKSTKRNRALSVKSEEYWREAKKEVGKGWDLRTANGLKHQVEKLYQSNFYKSYNIDQNVIVKLFVKSNES